MSQAVAEEAAKRIETKAPATLLSRVDALVEFIDTISTRLPRLAEEHRTYQALRRARELAEHAVGRLGVGGEHTVVAIVGATGGGKSSLFNVVSGLTLSQAGPLRPTTGEVHACVWDSTGAAPLLDWLAVSPSRRFIRESALDADDEASMRGLVLLDLPDMDSIAAANRAEVDRLLSIVDLLIWVVDPQKYADHNVHRDYLSRLGPLGDLTVIVLNQIDRLSPDDAQRCQADLARLAAADGLAGAPVLTASAVTGDGVGALRELLARAVASRRVALARIDGELDVMIQEVAGLVGARDGAAATLGPSDEAALTDAFVCAGGVSTAANQIGRSYASHGALAPRPARQRAAAAASVPRTDPVLVSQAVRELAGRAGAELPDPWQAELHGAATSDLASRAERLEAQLRAEVRRSRHQTRRAVGAVVVRTLTWLTIAAALAATTIILASSTGHQTPLVGRTTARWLFAASVAAVVLLLVGGRALVSWRGRSIAARVQQRLRVIARIHACECIGLLQAVLDDYRAARQSLRTAAAGARDGGG